MLKTDPEIMRKMKKIKADKHPRNFILNRVKEKICKVIKKTGSKMINKGQVNSKKEKKKNIFVVGDSILKTITNRGISKDHTVKIIPNPGATTVDMIIYQSYVTNQI